MRSELQRLPSPAVCALSLFLLFPVLLAVSSSERRYVVVFRGDNFSPPPLRVLINGQPSPDVLFHNSSFISFVIPTSLVKDDGAFSAASVEITVGESYVKFPLAVLRSALVEVEYHRFKKQVHNRAAASASPSQQTESPDHQLTDQQPTEQQSQSESDYDRQLQPQLREHVRTLQDPFSPSANLTSAYNALLSEVQQTNNANAIHALAVATLSNTPHSPISHSDAVSLLQRAADLGSAHAHAELAFLHATGIASHQIPKHEAAALLHWTIANEGGSLYAAMALAYRYDAAHSLLKNCPLACALYKSVADVTAPTSVPLRALLPTFLIPPPRRRLRDGRSSHPSKEVVQYVERAANRGDPSAQTEVAKLIYSAANSEAELKRATELFQRAAEAGRPDANLLLGLIYLKSGRNHSAIRHLLAAAAKREPNALHALGYVSLHGIGVKQNITAAVLHFQHAGGMNHPDSLFALSSLYEEGIGVPKSLPSSRELLRKAADLDHVQASYKLALLSYSDEMSTSHGCSNAVMNFKKVAESGVWGDYLDTAGRLYEQGKYSQALYRYLKAAHAGLDLAQYNAGFMYEKGNLVDGGTSAGLSREQLVNNAIEMYSMSAAQGDISSMIRVGDLAFAEKHDYEQAAAAYDRASRGGNAEACFNLGWMHARGLGMNPDKHMAKRYFDLAKDSHDNAWLPATIAVFGLEHYDTVFGGIELVLHIFKRHGTLFGDVAVVTVLLGVLVLVVNVRHRRIVQNDRDEGIEEDVDAPLEGDRTDRVGERNEHGEAE
ncbi:Protein sel-1-like [Gracilariopsis chorda]|uniref:Protein sel-1-like n=1 Tax=Gracilariopsis chorda TaxID=448386 RepID=A0A2V3J666_9FLOR|nr:Protein sel-1-like [Gracilariopsis chorda]|eukprot:PXF49803.1 Protein sel-1-like [Gracilariopsis chorda]